MSTISCACVFCGEFANHSPRSNRILWESEGFNLLPSIGSLTPGYLLLMPKRHIKSFAELDHDELLAALDIAEQARRVVSQEFGPAIVAEHGPGALGSRSSACCDHAHWHLIPCNPYSVSLAYEHAGGSPAILNDITHLRQWNGKSYLFLSPLKHVFWVWNQSEEFTSQFVRRVCAKILGVEELYDWAVFPFEENMILTKQRLAGPLQDAMSMLIAS